MKTISQYLAIMAIVSLTTSSSVIMAANQPRRKDVHVLDRGISRNTVIAELGAPAYSTVEKGKKSDIFTFAQGYSKEVRYGRTLFHSAADLFTVCAWELAGTPIKAMADGTKVKVEVFYGANDTVERVNVIEGNVVMKGVTSINQRQEQQPQVALPTNNSN